MRSTTLAMLLMAAAALGVSIYAACGRPTRLAFINAPKVVEAYSGTAKAQEAIKQRTAAWKANVDTLSQELEEAMKKYERERAGLSEKERALSEELLASKRSEFYRYQQNSDQRMREESERISTELVQQINKLTQAYAKKQGYLFVFGASGNGSLVYGDEEVDITDEVIKAINAQ